MTGKLKLDGKGNLVPVDKVEEQQTPEQGIEELEIPKPPVEELQSFPEEITSLQLPTQEHIQPPTEQMVNRVVQRQEQVDYKKLYEEEIRQQQMQQTQMARTLALNTNKIYISQLVQAKSIWVLKKVYIIFKSDF